MEHYDLFLSHARADRDWVCALERELVALGIRVFRDEKDLSAGDNFVVKLSDALKRSRFLALILSAHSVARPWVETEWSAFLVEHGPRGHLIPVKLHPVELPTILKSIQYVSALDRDARSIAGILADIVGRPDEARSGDSRMTELGQDLYFGVEVEGESVSITSLGGGRRSVEQPWRRRAEFGMAFVAFRELTQRALAEDVERGRLVEQATVLGRTLFELLFGDERERERLERATQPGLPPPVVTVCSSNDGVLCLPWELLYQGGRFLVRDGIVDLIRTTPCDVGPGGILTMPQTHFKLVVNVSAPEGSRLDYEGESYRLTRALADECLLVPTELGTLDDLIDTVSRARPTGIHFSGHGGPGTLDFEDEEGRSQTFGIDEVVGRLKLRASNALPSFFYLASCHGNTPGDPMEGKAGSESSAARVHREGVAQVVGYFNPIADDLSTAAEVALYSAIAGGWPTSFAVRQARAALVSCVSSGSASHRPSEAGRSQAQRPSAALGGRSLTSTHPFAWAQLVLYSRRGPDLPLSLPSAGASRQANEPFRRLFLGTGTRRRLRTGFIGRRQDLHRVRRAWRRGDRVFVFQGLGGLGKSTLAQATLPMLGSSSHVCTLWCEEAEESIDPVQVLATQFLNYCESRLGAALYEIDRNAGSDSVKRVLDAAAMVGQAGQPLVLYMDNLESLQADVESDDDEIGAWRVRDAQRLWRGLVQLARDSAALYVVASTRYINEDLRPYILAVSPLPPDAMFRLMGWFPALRQLSSPSRAALVGCLAGHPRAVEFCDDLVQHALDRYREDHGSWVPPTPDDTHALEREWERLVAPALSGASSRVEADLLLDAIWSRVLGAAERRMMCRLALFRSTWKWEVTGALGDPHSDRGEVVRSAEVLRRSSLVGQVAFSGEFPDGTVETLVEYAVHPLTRRYVAKQPESTQALRVAGHRAIGEYLEVQAPKSRYINTEIEAGYHLFQAGDLERAYLLLERASQFLHRHGRFGQALNVLGPFLFGDVLERLSATMRARALGVAGLGYLELRETARAERCFQRSIEVARECGDRDSECKSHGNLGLACAQRGAFIEALRHYEKQRELAAAIPLVASEAMSLDSAGNAYGRLGQWSLALKQYSDELAIGRRTDDRGVVCRALEGIAQSHGMMRELEQAKEAAKEWLAVADESDDVAGQARAHRALGNIAAFEAKPKEAIPLFERARKLALRAGDRRTELECIGNLGASYQAAGNLSKALELCEVAVEKARALRFPVYEAMALGSLATACADLRDIGRARDYYRDAIGIAKRLGRPDLWEGFERLLSRLPEPGS